MPGPGDAGELRRSFEQTFAGATPRARERVWREVFGAEYPEGVDPFSYVSATELDRLVADCGLGPGDLLVDVGCGRGGPGLHVAERTGARLLGLDPTPTALAAARDAARGRRVAATFRVGEFAATGVADGEAAAVLSIDALTFAEDKAAAVHEMARIVAPGGRFLATRWDYRATPPNRPAVADHRPLLVAAGFDVLAYEETARWRELWVATNLRMIAAERDLAVELGADAAARQVDGFRRQLVEQIPLVTRRVLLIARRRSGPGGDDSAAGTTNGLAGDLVVRF